MQKSPPFACAVNGSSLNCLALSLAEIDFGSLFAAVESGELDFEFDLRFPFPGLVTNFLFRDKSLATGGRTLDKTETTSSSLPLCSCSLACSISTSITSAMLID